MKKFFTAIIGGGFSGLCCAVMLGEKYGGNIAIIEGNKRVGKKILATGNGQGNITNMNMGKDYYHGDVDFAESALKRYGNTELINFFENLGLLTCAEENGKVYPLSYQAGAICDVLRFKLEELGVAVFTENYVESINKDKDFFIKCSNGNIFTADNVVLATGGSSGAGFMTDGKSYSLAKLFGHNVTKLAPSLVQIKTQRDKLKGLKGIKQYAKVGLYSDKSHICTFEGDVLFTDYGISGNSVFSLSAYLKDVKNPHIEIEFLPEISKGELFEKLVKKSLNSNMEKLLISVLPTRLAQRIIYEAGLTGESKSNYENIQKIIGEIKRYKLNVEGTLGFDCSQVTSGGIDTKDINVFTMQSKLEKGLYIIGEELNVDGNCGGYNLQWAFTSASIASEAIYGKN